MIAVQNNYITNGKIVQLAKSSTILLKYSVKKKNHCQKSQTYTAVNFVESNSESVSLSTI